MALGMTPLILLGGYFSKRTIETLYTTFAQFGASATVSTDSVRQKMFDNFSQNKTHIMGICAVLSLLYASSWGDRGKLGQLSGTYKSEKRAGSVDAEFRSRVLRLVKVAIPSWHCKEARYIVLLMVVIALRTQMSIWLAASQGRIVRTIIQGDFVQFVRKVGFMMLFAIPSSMVNSGLDYFQGLLSCSFRTRITKYFND